MLFDLTDQLVGFFLSHLAAAYHILYQVPRAFDDESAEASGSVHHVFHRRSHFAAGLEADLVSLRRHLGDSVLDVSATVTGAALRRRRRSALDRRSRGRRLGRFFGLSHHMLLMYCDQRFPFAGEGGFPHLEPILNQGD